MFNKRIRVAITTRFENEDNLKITRLADTYKEPGTVLTNVKTKEGKIEISFISSKACVKSLKKDLNLLNFVGIEGIMVIE